MNGEYIPKWPPNSPDLSAIELVWSIIKGMMHIFPPTNMEELKSLIRRIWYSIPNDISKRIKKHIKKRWDLCLCHKGIRLDKQLLRKISSQRKELKLRLSKNRINGIRISYNDKFVRKLKNKEIREKKEKIEGANKIGK